MRRLTFLLLLFAAAGFASSPDEGPTAVLRYRARNSMMLVTVAIDGKNRTLVLDTGAEQTMINFPQVSREQEMKLWQHSYPYIKERSRLKLANTVFVIDVIKADLTGTPLLKTADGILGQDVLSNYSSIRINFRQQTIELF